MKENTILGIIILLALTVFIIIIPSIYLISQQDGWTQPVNIPISENDFEIVKVSCEALNHLEIQIKNTRSLVINPRVLQWCLKRYAYQQEECYPVHARIEPNETLTLRSSISPPSRYFRVTVGSTESDRVIKEYETLVTCEKE